MHGNVEVNVWDLLIIGPRELPRPELRFIVLMNFRNLQASPCKGLRDLRTSYYLFVCLLLLSSNLASRFVAPASGIS